MEVCTQGDTWDPHQHMHQVSFWGKVWVIGIPLRSEDVGVHLWWGYFCGESKGGSTDRDTFGGNDRA